MTTLAAGETGASAARGIARTAPPAHPHLHSLLAALLLVWVGTASAAETPGAGAPQRVVSINLCTDLLVLSLLPRERIVSLGSFAADPAMSPLAHLASGIPANLSRVEEVVALAPDLVVAGRFNGAETLALLRRLGIPLMVMEVADSLHEVREQVRELSLALGVREHGEALIGTLDRRIATARAGVDTTATAPLAAVYRANGYTAGSDTLIDEVLAAAGLDNLAARAGIRGWGVLDLETLLLARPELLVLGDDDMAPALAGEALRHPALAALARSTASVRVPEQWWTCPGPWLAEAVETLAAARERVVRARR